MNVGVIAAFGSETVDPAYDPMTAITESDTGISFWPGKSINIKTPNRLPKLSASTHYNCGKEGAQSVTGTYTIIVRHELFANLVRRRNKSLIKVSNAKKSLAHVEAMLLFAREVCCVISQNAIRKIEKAP